MMLNEVVEVTGRQSGHDQKNGRTTIQARSAGGKDKVIGVSQRLSRLPFVTASQIWAMLSLLTHMSAISVGFS
jgi:hypothetical protein